MEKISIGSTHFSSEILQIKSIVELDHYNTLYVLTLKEYETILISNLSGYFEINYSFLKKHKIDNLNEFVIFFESKDDFFKKYFFIDNPKFFHDTLISENIFNTETIREINKNFNAILNKINTVSIRAVQSWYFTLYQKCFFNHAYPEVFLTKSGFTIENSVDAFSGTTKRTIQTNLLKLKKLNLIDFNYQKDIITNIRFNLNKFLLSPQQIPFTFNTAFYTENKINNFEPINNKLQKIGKIIDFQNQDYLKTIDYTQKQIENETIGHKSEQIALKFEIDRLIKLKIENAHEIAQIISENSTLGYDIISIEKNNEKRHIEVKTVKRHSEYYTFHITQNEIDKIETLKNYYIYIVIYGKEKTSVKIIKTNNMLKSEYFKIIPTNYKVFLKY